MLSNCCNVCCSVLQFGVVQCVVVCCSVSQCGAHNVPPCEIHLLYFAAVCWKRLQYVAVCCSVMQCIAVCGLRGASLCNLRVAVCCSLSQSMLPVRVQLT